MPLPPVDPAFLKFVHDMVPVFPWIVLVSFAIPTTAILGLKWDEKDTAANWETVATDDHYIYQQHKTKHKRRVRPDYYRKLDIYDTAHVKSWLKFKSETLDTFTQKTLGLMMSRSSS